MSIFSFESSINAMQQQIGSLGLDIMNCVAQCYDGASVMSGVVSDVQARSRELYPQAM